MKFDDLKVAILCGGQGTRFREETEFRPKPLIEIGGMPILWHIMKTYSHYGIKNFVLLLGYKGEEIKSFFMNYKWRSTDLKINLRDGSIEHFNGDETEDWNITMIDTGLDSLTEHRLLLAKKYLSDNEHFMLTYGDGLADIDIKKLFDFHVSKNLIGTISGIKPVSRYGKIVHKDGVVHEFLEKPVLNDLINGGFMVFKKEVLDYLSKDNVMLEHVLLPKLVNKRQMAIYPHDGFWHCMDTYRDKLSLEQLWLEDPKWKVWK